MDCENSQLMFYSEIIAVCCEVHTKHINTPCGHNVKYEGWKFNSGNYLFTTDTK